MTIKLQKDFVGAILDVGGGGDGVIGRVYGRQVTAIDNRQDELDEAPGGFHKLLMDARRLDFPQESFDHVTFFYSLMYMDRATQAEALREAARVLCTGGRLHIWDSDIASASPDAFMTQLDVVLPQEQLHTCYGIIKEDARQDAGLFIDMYRSQGLMLSEERQGDQPDFYLSFIR